VAAASLLTKWGADFIISLPTGGGKSLLYLIWAFADSDNLSIVFVPLQSLQSDTIARLKVRYVLLSFTLERRNTCNRPNHGKHYRPFFQGGSVTYKPNEQPFYRQGYS
jgi:superfamily II DNA helicase RecQ